ncbi:MAG: hypothetical protein AAFU85_19605 [Planctomycetota bacterium]
MTIGPLHSIARCPVCEGGLCGIRICTGDDPTQKAPSAGFVMCDECEAIWLEPDLTAAPTYADPESPTCPIYHCGLWGGTRWANREEVERLGWTSNVDTDLAIEEDTPESDR